MTSAVIASLNPNRDINESWPVLFLSHQRLVSFSAINTFKGFTEGAKVAFNLFDIYSLPWISPAGLRYCDKVLSFYDESISIRTLCVKVLLTTKREVWCRYLLGGNSVCYGLKSSIFVEGDVLLTSGSNGAHFP